MKHLFIILFTALLLSCSEPGSYRAPAAPVESYEYPGNTLVFLCQTMVDLSPDSVYVSQWDIPAGETIRFKIINSTYCIFDSSSDGYISPLEIEITGDNTLKTARLITLHPVAGPPPIGEEHYYSIQTWKNGYFQLIDYCIK